MAKEFKVTQNNLLQFTECRSIMEMAIHTLRSLIFIMIESTRNAD